MAAPCAPGDPWYDRVARPVEVAPMAQHSIAQSSARRAARRALRIGSAAGVLTAPAVALAHPDHSGPGSYGLAHFLGDPFHLLLLVLPLVAAALLLAFGRRSRRLLAPRRRR